MAPLADPGLVLPLIGRTLEVREAGSRSVAEAISHLVGSASLLLLLDNFEHLLEAARDISALLELAPGLKVLATSREPLRLRWEHELPVPPLQLPPVGMPLDVEALEENPAVRLFRERAQAVRPAFALTAENAADVVRICRRLDGLPLAIELAAARMRLMAPAALYARLERRLDLLEAPLRDAPMRHWTPRETIGWSYDLLTPPEQAAFRRLAVFAGGCTMDAVETVTGASLDRISLLVDKSLVVPEEGPDGEPRFRFLETIREFAMEQLQASGEETATRDAHLAWVDAFVERAEPEVWKAEQLRWIPRLLAEQDNVRAALRWSFERGDSEGPAGASGVWGCSGGCTGWPATAVGGVRRRWDRRSA